MSVGIRIMKNSLRACAFAPALSVLSLAVAVNAQAQTTQTDPVVVTAARVPTPLSSVLVSFDVINRNEIEQTQASSLADLLTRIAGFEYGRNGGPGTTTSFFLRGHNSVNLVVLIDGVKASTDGIGALSAIDIPLHRIERVEIMRGNASALYGNAANGGVIHIFTRQEAGASAQLGVGSDGARTADAAFSTKVGETVVFLRMGHVRSAQLSSMRVDQRPAANPDHDQTISNSVALGFEQAINTDHSVKLTLAMDNVSSEYDVGSGNPTDVHELDRQTRAAQLTWSAQWLPTWSSEISFSQTTQELEDRKNGILRTSDYDYGMAQSRQNGMRWTNELSLDAQTQLLVGLDHSNEDFKSDALLSGYDTNKTDTGVFAGLGTQIRKWNWQANWRHDRLVTRNRLDGSKTNDSENSVLFGTGYQINPEWKFLANASTGFRTPSVGERAYSGVELKNETFFTRELGAVYQASANRLKVTYFQSDMNDTIAYNRTSDLVNLDAENSGVEATAQTIFGNTEFGLRWTEQDPRNLDTGKSLARRAKRLVGVDLKQILGQHHVGLSVSYQGKRRDSDFSDEVLDAHTLLGVNASYRISPQWRLVAHLENALDTEYQLAHGYNTPGRSAFVSLNYSSR